MNSDNTITNYINPKSVKPPKDYITKLYYPFNTGHPTINIIRINDDLFKEELEKQNAEPAESVEHAKSTEST